MNPYQSPACIGESSEEQTQRMRRRLWWLEYISGWISLVGIGVMLLLSATFCVVLLCYQLWWPAAIYVVITPFTACGLHVQWHADSWSSWKDPRR